MNNQSEIWGSPEIVLSTPKKIEVRAVSNSSVTSLLFQIGISLESNTDPMSVTQVFSFRIPIKVLDSQFLVGFQQDMTMGIVKTSGSRVSVIAILASSIKTFEFGFTGDSNPALNIPNKVESFYSLQGRESTGVDQFIKGPAPAYEATFIITAQRRSKTDIAIFSIDSLDIAAHIFESSALKV
jgi:hypothetical protein